MSQPLYQFDVVDLSGDEERWRMALHLERIALIDAAGNATDVIVRPELPLRMIVVDRLLLARTVVWTLGDGERKSFQLDEPDFRTLQAWIGPPTTADLKIALNRRLRYMIPVGCILMVLSLPIGTEGAPAGMDWIGLGLGASLVVLGVLNRLRPSRFLFVFDGLWFLALSGRVLLDIIRGDSEWWFVFVALGLWLTVTAFESFRRFRHLRPERIPPPTENS